MARLITKGATDQSTVIRIIDETAGTPETGVVFNTAGIDLWYRREGATKTSITEATLSALNDAHSDGGILHIGDGYYRLDLPDAAVASGVDGVAIGGTVTGMIVIGVYHQLVDLNPSGQSSIDLRDFADDGYDPSTNKVQGVVLADTVTTYTGNTPQTGDAYAIVNSGTYGNSALKTLVDTVDTVADAVKVKTDFLPSATAGAAGGVFIAGTNAPVTITGSGNALTLSSTGANGHGMYVTGNGSGDGAHTIGGATGMGARFTGGGTSGSGIYAQAGNAGVGIVAAAAGAGNAGFDCIGVGSGSGFLAEGGATGHGFYGIGGATSGSGMNLAAQTSGAGLKARGTGSGDDIDAPDTIIGTVTAVTTVNGLAANVITAAATAADAGVEIAAAVWDRVLNAANHNIASSAGRRLRQLDASSILSGTAAAGATNSITLDGSASATNDLYDENLIVITGGTGAGQTRIIVEYNGSTKVAIVNRLWEVTPSTDSTYDIIAWARENIVEHGVAQAGGATSITLASDASATDDIYIGCQVYLSTSTGSGQTRLITDYVGSTKVATVSPAWVTNPTSSSVYNIIPSGRSIVETLSGTSATDIRTAVGLASANLDTQLGDLPTAAENAAALMDLSNGVETSITPRQALRLILAASAGKLSGAATTTITIRNVGDSKDRITATVDSDGNRSAVTTDAT